MALICMLNTQILQFDRYFYDSFKSEPRDLLLGHFSVRFDGTHLFDKGGIGVENVFDIPLDECTGATIFFVNNAFHINEKKHTSQTL